MSQYGSDDVPHGRRRGSYQPKPRPAGGSGDWPAPVDKRRMWCPDCRKAVRVSKSGTLRRHDGVTPGVDCWGAGQNGEPIT